MGTVTLMTDTYSQIMRSFGKGSGPIAWRLSQSEYDTLCKEVIAAQLAKDEPVFYRAEAGITLCGPGYGFGIAADYASGCSDLSCRGSIGADAVNPTTYQQMMVQQLMGAGNAAPGTTGQNASTPYGAAFTTGNMMMPSWMNPASGQSGMPQQGQPAATQLQQPMATYSGM